MKRALVKKELLEAFAWVYRNRKTGKPHPVWKSVALTSLYCVAFAFLMHKIYEIARTLCLPMMEQDLQWLFLALMGLASLSVASLSNVFHAYAAVCRLQEERGQPNEPQLVSASLRAKLTSTYLMGLFYSLIFMVPAIIVHLQYAPPSALGMVLTLCIPLLLGALVLVFSCVIAYFVIAVTKRIRNKNILTVILSGAFLGGYYYLFEKSQDIYAAVLENAALVAWWTKRLCYPFYHMGLGAQGSLLSAIIFVMFVLLVIGVALLLIWKSYNIRIRGENRE